MPYGRAHSHRRVVHTFLHFQSKVCNGVAWQWCKCGAKNNISYQLMSRIHAHGFTLANDAKQPAMQPAVDVSGPGHRWWSRRFPQGLKLAPNDLKHTCFLLSPLFFAEL